MKIRRLILATALVLLCAGGLFASESAAVPDLLTGAEKDPSRKPMEPMWISADRARGSDGNLDEHELGQYAGFLRRMALDDSRAKAAEKGGHETERCHIFMGEPVCSLPPPPDAKSLSAKPEVKPEPFYDGDSLDALVASANAVMMARVVGMKAGFLWGRPATLLALSGSMLKGEAPSRAYLYYPFAAINTTEGMVCAGLPPTEPPALDERVLIFQTTQPLLASDGSVIFYVDIPRNVVYERRSGLLIPASLKGRFPAEMKFETIVDETEKSVARTPRFPAAFRR